MSRPSALVLLALVACTRHPRTDGAPDAAADASPDVQARPVPPAPAQEARLELPFDGGFAELVHGTASPELLPEVASDPDYDFDRNLRAELTTVTVHGAGIGSIGHGVNDEPMVDRKQRPKGTATIVTTTSSFPSPSVERIAAALRPRFRQCYQTGLEKDAALAGTVVVLANVTKEGEVSDAAATPSPGFSADVAACVATVARRGSFDVPPGKGAEVTLTIAFSR